MTIDLLVTLDEGYLEPLKVMLYSLKQNNAQTNINVHLIHENIATKHLDELDIYIKKLNWQLQIYTMPEGLWQDAPTMDRYPKEMYFRLLSGEILPESLHKILYLDPDILVINEITPLWQLDLGEALLAAATHAGVTNLTNNINHLRLSTDSDYYNSGVMLINLDVARQQVKVADIQRTLEKYRHYLILPDQDVLNHLYGQFIKQIPEEIWNYDTRKNLTYLAKSLGEHNLFWVMQNTAILHFCGRPKPWDPKSDSKFTALYLQYQQQVKRMMQ